MTVPRPRGYVTDEAGVIDWRTRSRLDEVIAAAERATSAEIAILTVSSTAPLDMFEYSMKVFDDWKIGKRGKNNGVLFLVAVQERRMRVTVGYGLEEVLTDVELGRLRDMVVATYLRDGRYAEGILAATEAIALELTRSGGSAGGGGRRSAPYSWPSLTQWILVVVVVLALVGLPLAIATYKFSARDRRLWIATASVACLGAVVLQASDLTLSGGALVVAAVAAVVGWFVWKREALFAEQRVRRGRGGKRRGGDGLDWTDGVGGGGHGSWSWSGGGFDGGAFAGFGGGDSGGGGAGNGGE